MEAKRQKLSFIEDEAANGEADGAADQAADGAADQAADGAADQAADGAADQAADGSGESVSGGSSDVLAEFLIWCKEMGVKINPKVCISKEGTVADYGMLACGNLAAGELLFLVPRTALLSQYTTSIASLLQKEKSALRSDSGWVPLLMALLYEYTNSASRWRPYFALLPDLNSLDHPMFWPEEEVKRLLHSTGVPEVVKTDLENMQLEYFNIVMPFMMNHPDLFQPERHTPELYKQMVALVMAYSFQEPEEEEGAKHPIPPMMVPVADTLNHVDKHNAHLEFSKNYLRMVTTKKITKGQEIFNTYGQMANWQLLHMYGFALPYPTNINDVADIQMGIMHRAALRGAKTRVETERLEEMWTFLRYMEMVGEEGAFVIGRQEVLTVEELLVTLKVMTFSARQYKDYKDNRRWEADMNGELSTRIMAIEEIPALKPSWKRLLHASIKLTIKSYNWDLATDERMMGNPRKYAALSSRERRALQVRFGQKMILHHLFDLSG